MERGDKGFACFILLGIMFTHKKLFFPITTKNFDLVGGGGVIHTRNKIAVGIYD